MAVSRPVIHEKRTLFRRIQGSIFEDVDPLHLSNEFKTLETGRLLEIGGDSAGTSTRGKKILLLLDIYTAKEGSAESWEDGTGRQIGRSQDALSPPTGEQVILSSPITNRTWLPQKRCDNRCFRINRCNSTNHQEEGSCPPA